jgi:hypothetical protein
MRTSTNALRFLTAILMMQLSHAVAAQETNSEKLWRSYANEMRAFIAGPGGDVNGLQLVSVAEVADWDNDRHADYNRDVKWCDSIPKFGPMYEDSGRKVSEAYRLYLESLKLPSPDPAKETKVAAARKAWTAALNKENQIAAKVGSAWIAFQATQAGLPENRRKSYDGWYAGQYGQLVGDARTELTAKAQTYSALLSETYQGYGAVVDAVRSYANDAYQLNSEAPNGLKLPHRTCSMSPLLKDLIDRGKLQGAANTFAHSLTISTTHHELHESEWGASAGGSFLGFISVGGSGGYEHREVHESNHAFLLDIKFRNLEVVSFQRSPWFSGTVIALLNKNQDFVSGAAVDADKLWGAGGLFRLLPVAAVVAYQPTLTVTMDDADYNYVHSQWNAGLSIGWGPFSISGAAHGSNTDVVWDDNKRTITATFKTESPYVIAVKNVVMPNL